jgi:hypothetical protein
MPTFQSFGTVAKGLADVGHTRVVGKPLTHRRLLALRFANADLEPAPSATVVEPVQVAVAEDFGAQDLGQVREAVGALRNVVVNRAPTRSSRPGPSGPAGRNPQTENWRVMRALPYKPSRAHPYAPVVARRGTRVVGS